MVIRVRTGINFPGEGWVLNVEEHKGTFYKILKVFSILIRAT